MSRWEERDNGALWRYPLPTGGPRGRPVGVPVAAYRDRRRAANPTRPVAKSNMDAGSGTVADVSVVIVRSSIQWLSFAPPVRAAKA